MPTLSLARMVRVQTCPTALEIGEDEGGLRVPMSHGALDAAGQNCRIDTDRFSHRGVLLISYASGKEAARDRPRRLWQKLRRVDLVGKAQSV